jgi:hypothetical protein
MTKTDIRTEVLVRLGKDTTSAWTSATIVNSLVDQAHKWASAYKKWPFTEGRQSTTFASLVTNEDGDLRGEFPEGWKSDSIRIMQICGYRLQKLNYEDYRIFREENSSSTDRVFSDFARNYVINPHIDVSGTITAWGQFTPAVLDDESTTDNTVFGGEDEGNQAIIEEAMAYLLRRDGKEKESIERHQYAQVLLDQLYQRIGDEQYAYQSKNRGMFQRIDLINGDLYGDELNTDQFN